jgi:hypothetical protein
MPFDTYAYFFVRGFSGDPEQVSARLALTPDRVWRQGDAGAAGKPKPFSNWELYSPLPRAEVYQDAHLLALLEILEGQRARVLEVIAQYTCGLQCVGYYTGENPGFHMDAALISRIASLGLSVDFDLYCSCDCEPSEAQDL